MASIAPPTSAYLMSQCNKLMFKEGLDAPDTHRRHVCGTCGNIMTGWTGSVQIRRTNAMRRKGKRKRNASTEGRTRENKGDCNANTEADSLAHPARAMAYICDFCSQETQQSLPNTSSIARRANPQPFSSSLQSNIHQPLLSSNINSSSKKRAKARKQGGLQALLAKNKEASSFRGCGFGLDLLDLLKET